MRTNIPVTREAGLAEARSPHAGSASALRPSPSSTLQYPRPESEQHSPGSPELGSFRFTIARKSSGLKDNSFPLAVLYLSETTPLSLHFGEPRLPVFSPVILMRAHFARRRIWASRAMRRALCDAAIARLARFPTTLRPSVSSPTVSSARESPCPHAFLPSGMEARSAPLCPVYC